MRESTKQHLYRHHTGQLPPGFRKQPSVSWEAVHNLLHRLSKWKGWKHV